MELGRIGCAMMALQSGKQEGQQCSKLEGPLPGCLRRSIIALSFWSIDLLRNTDVKACH